MVEWALPEIAFLLNSRGPETPAVHSFSRAAYEPIGGRTLPFCERVGAEGKRRAGRLLCAGGLNQAQVGAERRSIVA